MGTVNGVGIRVGQVWRTRDGNEARITSTTSGMAFPVLAIIDGVPVSYTTSGRWATMPEYAHARDLVELIAGPACEEHQMVPAGESVEYVEGEVLPATGVEDDTLAVCRQHTVESDSHGTGAFTTVPESIQLAEGDPIPVPEIDGDTPITLSEAWAAQDLAEAQRLDIDPRFAAAHYGHDLRPGDGLIGVPVQPAGNKDTNPKDAVGIRKAPFSVLPWRVLTQVGLAMLEGAAKYGRHNYRGTGVRASVYFDAVVARHLTDWWEGSDIDPDSNLHEVIKAIAGLMVLADAIMGGTLVDDRPPRGNVNREELNRMAAEIIDRHADKKPYHYTIADSDDTEGGAA